MSKAPVVLLVQPADAKHQHATMLEREGFRVEISSDDRISENAVLAIAPGVIAIEMEDARSADTFDLARRLRANLKTRPIPLILYATHLEAKHIEDAARAGIMWLQIGSADGQKLVAAVRGVIAGSPRQQ